MCSVLLMSTTMFVIGCASKPTVQQTRKMVYVPEFYTVQAGESLSSIAAKFNLNYMDIAAINQIDSVDRIYVNQSLRLRKSERDVVSKVQTKPIEQNVEIKRESVVVSAPLQVNKTIEKPANTIVTPPTNQGKNQSSLTTSSNANLPVIQASGLKWVLPSQGPVIKHFDVAQNLKGIRFGGKLGDPIYAASAGEVVYADDGLKEYGKLILLRHNNGYITAYAHNNQLIAKAGDRVETGQKIATMGNTGTSSVMLEFQIRLDGKPIDPKTILPLK